jgi:hypothetical protein
MKWLMVGKTSVPYGQGTTQYILINEGAGALLVQLFPTLIQLSKALPAFTSGPDDREPRFIKNDVPAVIWYPNTGDKVAGDDVLECQRLDKDDLHELARLLRQ